MSRTKSERKKKQKTGPVRRLVYQREQKLSHSLGGIVLEEEEEKKRLHLHIAELVTSGRAVGDAPVLGTRVSLFVVFDIVQRIP